MKTLILREQGLEECEALIVYDLLTRAGIEVALAGSNENITSSHNLIFKTNISIDEVKPSDYDCLVLPGGMPGTTNLEKNIRVNEIIDYFISNHKLTCAICAAPSILIKKGLLKNNEFTCFPGFECGYESTKEKVHVKDNIITSNGLGSAIEFGLKIIEVLISKDKAIEIKNKIQY